VTDVLVVPRIGAENTTFETGILGAFDQMVVSSTSTDVIDDDSAQLLDDDGSILGEDGKSTYRAAVSGDLT
jgi:hypothetical protein